jgi:hypothetical protein
MKTFKLSAISIISNWKILTVIFILLALIASIQSLTMGMKTFYEGGHQYTDYNNYIIFKNSFSHLIHNQDLYTPYPDEYWDLYKYTPTFSIVFSAFYFLPDWAGLIIWNLLNSLILLISIYYLPKLSPFQKGLALLILIIELMTSLQNSQSNGLIAGLLVFSLGLLERRKNFLAILCITLTVFIKPFGIVGFAILLLYPNKIKNFIYVIIIGMTLLFLPLIFININQFETLYTNYINLIANDHNTNALFSNIGPTYGYSVMGILNSWFAIDYAQNHIVIVGIIIFLIPLYKIQFFKEIEFRYFLLSSILIWIVVFNHKAESPTFIIALTGIALWFVNTTKSITNIVLILLVIIFTSLSSSDLFPKQIRETFLIPYKIKAFPCVLIWLKITYEMITLKTKQLVNSSNEN